MELWIRSQNKGTLMKVEILGQTDGIIKAYFPNGNAELGNYQTVERALKVLDEIQTTIRNKYAISLKPTTVIASMPLEKVYKALNQVAVYEMPKD